MDAHPIHVTPASLHQRVTSDLLARIQSGEFAPGSMIPTEAVLCGTYGVSRITIRRAMAALVGRGLVTRRRGVGSFVTGRAPDLREFHLIGFLDETLAYDYRLLRDANEAAAPRIAEALGIEPGSPVRHIASLVHRDGEPFTLTDAYTADLPDRRIERADYAARLPSAQAMGQRLGRRIARAEQDLDAVAADAEAARHLGIDLGAPVIRARRVYRSADDQPIQYLIVRYHPSRYRFVVDLVPRAGTTAFQSLPQPRPAAKRAGKTRENTP